MGPALTLPRLIFGDGALDQLASELALLGVARPLLISDRGLEAAGVVERAAPITRVRSGLRGRRAEARPASPRARRDARA